MPVSCTLSSARGAGVISSRDPACETDGVIKRGCLCLCLVPWSSARGAGVISSRDPSCETDGIIKRGCLCLCLVPWSSARVLV